ncbi:Sec-independent protein translocase protein TatB [Uliginosibacterium aquaticum]|uniref:Sec-independent protein translocase protein TatB n=1 Tax=Uliginosibacterium aquaticum TaxID=2731212 RepID=A0ABX2IK28_9RHOO|nr:Sec-independent protein translocase protein TatB [Uliginosibacterium aquaticum]NSL54400.1 twin-arginine translocase subunit TatB [Uliginosibacterium aquaticum]
MFDIGFSELLLIGIVALVVFGPEELPRVARTVGHLLGKMRRYVADVKSDISREMEASEMKTLVADVQESARSLQASINEQAQAFQAELSAGAAAVEQEVKALAEPVVQELPPPAETQAVAVLLEQVPAETVAAESDLFASSEPTPPPQRDDSQLDLFGMPVESVKVHKG